MGLRNLGILHLQNKELKEVYTQNDKSWINISGTIFMCESSL